MLSLLSKNSVFSSCRDRSRNLCSLIQPGITSSKFLFSNIHPIIVYLGCLLFYKRLKNRNPNFSPFLPRAKTKTGSSSVKFETGYVIRLTSD